MAGFSPKPEPKFGIASKLLPLMFRRIMPRQLRNVHAACATDNPVACCVCMSVCLSRACAVQKRQNRLAISLCWSLCGTKGGRGRRGLLRSLPNHLGHWFLFRILNWTDIFLPPDATRWRGICYVDVAVCLSVMFMRSSRDCSPATL